MDELDWTERHPLRSGGELRAWGSRDAPVSVLLVGGGTKQSRPGRWSASMTWLAPRVAAMVDGRARVAQLRYVDSSWDLLDQSIENVRETIELEHDAGGARRSIVIVSLSMGGATCLVNMDRPGVVGMVTMAPWFPTELPIDALAGRRLFVVHGQLDNALPFVPGTSRSRSRETVRLARELGSDARWQGMPLGLHGLAVRWRGRILTLPRARAYARVLLEPVDELVRQAAPVSTGASRRRA